MRRAQPRSQASLLVVLSTCLFAVGCAGQSASLPASTEPAAATNSPTPSPTPEPAVQATSEPAEEAPAGAATITVNNDGAAFHPEDVTLPADAVVFFLVHEGEAGVAALHHNMHVGTELPPGAALLTSPTLDPGESIVLTVTGLEPGTYRYWCSVNEHYTFGMVGTLTVTP